MCSVHRTMYNVHCTPLTFLYWTVALIYYFISWYALCFLFTGQRHPFSIDLVEQASQRNMLKSLLYSLVKLIRLLTS